MIVRRMAGAVVALLAVLGAFAPAAGGQTPREACQAGPKLVDVYYRYADDQILDSQGRVVGLSSGIGHFRLYQLGPDTFCAISYVAGTFTTFAGPSPAGTGTVPEGLRGHVVGENVLLFTGEFVPTLPTRGYVGEFDANCDQFECETPIRFGRQYLETGPPEVLGFRFVHYTRCGIWIQTESSDVGDIAC
ncbi:MAG TPA: hypothetical protein VHF27_07740 [Acidimicrobiales bacterium]|nr:hypothetical protein [Acidimicrobiales bacterium]